MRHVWVSTNSFKSALLDRVLDVAAAHDIRHVELSSNIRWQQDVIEIVRARHRNPFEFLIHNYFPPARVPFVLNLASPNRTTRAASVAHCRMAIELSAELGAPFYGVHSGFAFDATPGDLGGSFTSLPRVDRTEALRMFVDSVGDLASMAGALGVSLAIENNVVTRENTIDGRNELLLCATAEEICDVLRQVGHNSLGVLVDLGHLKVSSKTLGFDCREFLEQIRPHTVALHVSDNDGSTDEHRSFDNGAWFMPLLAGFACPMVLESHALSPDDILACSRVVRSLNASEAHG